MPSWYLQNSKRLSNFFKRWNKLPKKKRKNLPRSSTPWAIFFLLGYQREKTSFGASNGKKTSFTGPRGGLKKGSFYFLWSPKGSFFHLVPQRKFFSLWYPKGKKFAQGVEDRGNFFYFFWQFFSTCEKITQILEFSKYQGGKI